jgi:small subunit ribosomal protein S3
VGQKVHPIGFRLGVKVGERSVKDWDGRWFATGREYSDLLLEDIRVREHIMTRMADAGVAKVEIERSANMITVTIHAAKPGIVIGKSGVKVEELRRTLEAKTGKRIRVTIQEIRQPEINAMLVARSIADQLEKRVAFRRAMKQAVQRAQRFGAKGVRVQVSGRLGGSEMSRREWDRWGRVPLHTLRADIDYGQTEARTTYGVIGVKVWVYRGDFTPDGRSPEEVSAEQRQPDRRGPRATVRAEVAPEAPAPEMVAPAVPAEVDYSRGGVFEPGEDSGDIRPRPASGETTGSAAPTPPLPPTPPARPAPTPPRPPTPPTPPRIEE